jgi:hypothetical protein
MALRAVLHTLPSLTGWTMDRDIEHSISLWRPEQMGHSISLATHVKHPDVIMDERCDALDKSLRPYYISF